VERNYPGLSEMLQRFGVETIGRDIGLSRFRPLKGNLYKRNFPASW
jgi:hypothetical protein